MLRDPGWGQGGRGQGCPFRFTNRGPPTRIPGPCRMRAGELHELHEPCRRLAGQPETVVDGDAWHPCDLSCPAEQRQPIPLPPRDATVDQDVLQLPAAGRPQRPQAVAGAAVRTVTRPGRPGSGSGNAKPARSGAPRSIQGSTGWRLTLTVTASSGIASSPG